MDINIWFAKSMNAVNDGWSSTLLNHNGSTLMPWIASFMAFLVGAIIIMVFSTLLLRELLKDSLVGPLISIVLVISWTAFAFGYPFYFDMASRHSYDRIPDKVQLVTTGSGTVEMQDAKAIVKPDDLKAGFNTKLNGRDVSERVAIKALKDVNPKILTNKNVQKGDRVTLRVSKTLPKSKMLIKHADDTWARVAPDVEVTKVERPVGVQHTEYRTIYEK